MQCPSCGAGDQTGKYCAECGAAMDARCPECSAPVEADDRFCPDCGAAVSGSRSSSRSSGQGGGRGGGYAIGIAVAVAAAVVALMLFLPGDTERAGPRSMTGSTPEAPFANGGSSADGSGGGMPALSGDMRTNADRLFNRVMVAAEQDNVAEVEQFLPMAIQAYQISGDLDGDALYHVAILQLTAGEYADARQTAQQILDGSPNHVLALGLAASAAAEAGDSAAAGTYYRRLLDVYGAESAKPLPEYVDHQQMLEVYRDMAREFDGGA